MERAWPAKGKRDKPDGRLAQFLARQVGPVTVPAAGARAAQRDVGPPGGRASPRRVRKDAAPTWCAPTTSRPTIRPPRAWRTCCGKTYDSAISAVALESDGGTRARRASCSTSFAALQRTDGSLDFAYDTSTGARPCSCFARARSPGWATRRCCRRSAPARRATTR